MATLLQTYNGNTAKNASQTNQHYVRARLYLDSNTGSGYTMHWVWDVYLIKWTAGVGRTFTYKYGGTSTTFDQSYKSVSNVAVQTKTGGSFTVAYGSSCSTTAQAVWYTDGGTAQNSTLSVSYTVPRPTYTISYNANGGTGAPASQSKVYGTNITLSTVVPTREAYIFKGWSTSSTATTATYQPGGTFSTNANTVLYAVWSLIKTNSKITSMKLKRCLQDGTEDNEGTYCKITVNYAADITQDADNTIVRLKWLLSNDESGIININQAEGSTVIINQNELVLEENCSATVLITDEYTDDGTEIFEEYSDLQKRMVYAPSLLKRPKLYIKNWYNTKVSEYGDSLIEFPDELSSALGSDQLYANTIQNDEEIFNNYTLNLTSNNIAKSTFNDLIIEGQSEQNNTPTLSAPVPIVSVESRNLLDASYFTSTAGGQTYYSVSGDVLTVMGSDGRNWVTMPTFVLPAGTYALSRSNGSGATYVKRLVDGQLTAGYALTLPDGTLSGTLTLSEATTVAIRLGYNAASYPFDVRIQLERGTTANPYQPYGCVTLVAGSTRTDIDLQGHALRSLPDGTHDEMAVDSLGRVTMTQRVGSVDMGTLAWTLGTLGSGAAFFYSGAIADRKAGTRVMAAPFASVEGNRNNITADCQISDYNSGNGRVAARYDSIATAVDFQTAMTGVMLYYKLATPQTIDLGTIELPVISENNVISIDALVSPTLNILYNENIVYADELNDLFIYLYNAGEWNDNSDPLTGTSICFSVLRISEVSI